MNPSSTNTTWLIILAFWTIFSIGMAITNYWLNRRRKRADLERTQLQTELQRYTTLIGGPDELEQRERQLQARRSAIEHQERSVRELAADLEHRRGLIIKIEELHQQEDTLKSWQTRLAQRQQELKALQTEQDQATQHINHQANHLQAAEAELKRQEAQIEARAAAIMARETELDKRMQGLSRQEDEIVTTEQRVAEQKASHQPRWQKVRALETELVQRERALDTQRQELDQQQHTLNAQEQQVIAAAEKLKQQRTALVAEEAQLTQNRVELARRVEELATFDRALIEQQQSLQARAHKIQEIETDLKKWEPEVIRTQAQLARADEQLKLQQTELDHAETRLRERLRLLQQELELADQRAGVLQQAEQLFCYQCWQSWRVEEAFYMPVGSVLMADQLLTEHEHKIFTTKGFTYGQLRYMLQQPRWSEWIKRHRPQLNSIEKQLAVLFQPHCPLHFENPSGQHNASMSLAAVANNWLIPIVGASAAGKTVYVTALIRQLKRMLGSQYGYLIEEHDQQTINAYDELQQEIFDQHSFKPTQRDNHRSMIFHIKPLGNPENKQLTLFFNDVAGEEWQTIAKRNHRALAGFLLNARSIMFLVDPLADPALRQRFVSLSNDSPPTSTSLDRQYEVIRRMCLFIKEASGYQDRVPIDALLVIAKSDLLQDILFPADHPVYQSLDAGGASPIPAIVNLSNEIVEQLQAQGVTELYNQYQLLSRTFQHVTCFAVSALGHAPIEPAVATLERPRPAGDHRESESFLWSQRMGSSPEFLGRTSAQVETATSAEESTVLLDPQRLRSIHVEDPILWTMFRAGLLR